MYCSYDKMGKHLEKIGTATTTIVNSCCRYELFAHLDTKGVEVAGCEEEELSRKWITDRLLQIRHSILSPIRTPRRLFCIYRRELIFLCKLIALIPSS